MVHHHNPECYAKRLGSYLQGHSAGSNSQNLTVSSISPEFFLPFATKFGIVVHHHESECCVTILDCCLEGQGHSEGSNPQGIFVRTISSKLFNLSS